jgi:dienelactone hydrolase
MKKNFCSAVVLTIALAFTAFNATAQNTLADGRVGAFTFDSMSPPDFWQYARRNLTNTKAATINAELLMPKNIAAGSRVPALVISHGSTGLSPFAYEVWAAQMNAAGVAVLVFDSFKARGVDATANDQSLVSPASQVADALNALRVLATHPQIDARRIVHIGFSRGGSTAFYTAWPMFQAPVNTNGARFAAHIPVYPGHCNIRYRANDDVDKATAPIFMALAERGKEDWQDVAVCERYAKELAASGQPVTYKEYEGAYHAFDERIPFRYFNNANVSTQCDMELQMTPVQGSGLGRGARDMKTNRELKNFEEWLSTIRGCMTHTRARIEGNSKQSAVLVADVLRILDSLKK